MDAATCGAARRITCWSGEGLALGPAVCMPANVAVPVDEIVSIPNQVFRIDPLQDPRWPGLTERHPSASVYHSRPWLQALQLTYGYEPIAVTTAQPTAPLGNAVVFCIVRSWLTGDRLVSLPFSDHCEPLLTHPEEFRALTSCIETIRQQQRLKYTQIRSTKASMEVGACFAQANRYYLHRLDLRPNLEDLYRKLHKDCIQRKIRRAERERLECTTGRSESLLVQLYSLLRMTRARHGIPPQPIEWFKNLVDCMGQKLCIRIASKQGRPVAGILTLTHGKQVFYKYGASDPAYTHLGGTAMLLWNAITQAKQDGAESLDLGRSDLDHSGLITFKARWGAESCGLTTWEAPASMVLQKKKGLTMQYVKWGFGCLPYGIQSLTGRLLYRHIG